MDDRHREATQRRSAKPLVGPTKKSNARLNAKSRKRSSSARRKSGYEDCTTTSFERSTTASSSARKTGSEMQANAVSGIGVSASSGHQGRRIASFGPQLMP
jgi:hypothetical protein